MQAIGQQRNLHNFSSFMQEYAEYSEDREFDFVVPAEKNLTLPYRLRANPGQCESAAVNGGYHNLDRAKGAHENSAETPTVA